MLYQFPIKFPYNFPIEFPLFLVGGFQFFAKHRLCLAGISLAILYFTFTFAITTLLSLFFSWRIPVFCQASTLSCWHQPGDALPHRPRLRQHYNQLLQSLWCWWVLGQFLERKKYPKFTIPFPSTGWSSHGSLFTAWFPRQRHFSPPESKTWNPRHRADRCCSNSCFTSPIFDPFQRVQPMHNIWPTHSLATVWPFQHLTHPFRSLHPGCLRRNLCNLHLSPLLPVHDRDRGRNYQHGPGLKKNQDLLEILILMIRCTCLWVDWLWPDSAFTSMTSVLSNFSRRGWDRQDLIHDFVWQLIRHVGT